MRMLFSIIGLLVVVGIAVWWMMRDFSHDVGLISPQNDPNTGAQIETPIDQAKQAKELIESHPGQIVEP